MLGTVRANILHNNGTDIIRMSCVTVVAVFVSVIASVIAWFYITASLSLIFSSILDVSKSSSWGQEIRL